MLHSQRKSLYNPEQIKKQYYANGKVLLTGEYGVLDGAKALALPTKLGQSLKVGNTRGSDLIWEAFDADGKKWFKSNISLYDFSPVKTTDEKVSKRLQKILNYCVRQNSEFLSKWNGFKVQTRLSFNRQWGLGSSSTLYCLIADWAEVNPLLLYFAVEDGSGYDVACGWAEGPILYTNSPDEISYTEIDWAFPHKDKLHFVYLKQKKDSREAIEHYKSIPQKNGLVKDLTSLTDAIIECKDLQEFNRIIDEHENILSKSLKLNKVKDERFQDFPGSIKSLGAWGGDFILVSSEEDTVFIKNYFSEKGYDTLMSYADLILS